MGRMTGDKRRGDGISILGRDIRLFLDPSHSDYLCPQMPFAEGGGVFNGVEGVAR